MQQTKLRAKPTYLGNVLINPRTALGRFFDPEKGGENDTQLCQWIQGALALPHHSAAPPQSDIYILDIEVLNFRRGERLPFELALLSRPRVHLQGRLRDSLSGKTMAVHASKKAMSVRAALAGLANPKAWLGLRPKTDAFKALLIEALAETVQQIKGQMR